MTIDNVLKFIQETSWQGSKLGLDRMQEALSRLGNPQNRLKYIHVTGSNGKGSISMMIASILSEAGYRVGLYTSPHIEKYNERMKINGEDINDIDFCMIADRVKKCIDNMEDKPTEFERITIMALLYFKEQKCDFVIMEVGLGGRLDATNVIPSPEVAVIANIGLEHTEYLGNTVEKIATEKAGIIKPGASVVLYQQSKEAEDAVRRRCQECGSELYITAPEQENLVEKNFRYQILNYRMRKNLKLNLIGTFQYKNAAVVLDTIDCLIKRGYPILEKAVSAGIEKASWPGRFEVLQEKPLIILDGAHNTNAIQEIVECLNVYLQGKKITFVIGVMKDKDYETFLYKIAPFAQQFITVTPDNSRALPSGMLKEFIVENLNVTVKDAGTVEEGVRMVLREQKEDEVVYIFGSLYQISEVKRAFWFFN